MADMGAASQAAEKRRVEEMDRGTVSRSSAASVNLET
jgi:hypothetical protein